MALTLDQLEARRSYLGSSDVPAMLGVDPYRDIIDVWLEKTGRLELKVTSSKPADLGSRLEQPLVQLAADMLETPVEFDRRRRRDDILSSQADGWLPELNELVEAKVYGLWNRMFDTSEWGEEGTDHVPFRVMAQVVFNMYVQECDTAHVIALLGGGMGYRLYTLHRSQGLIDEIVERAHAFWTDHVQADVPPEGLPRLGTLKDRIREPDKMVEVDHDLPGRWRSMQDQKAIVKGADELLKRTVLHALGDAEKGYTPFGTFTHLAGKRGRRTLRLKEGS